MHKSSTEKISHHHRKEAPADHAESPEPLNATPEAPAITETEKKETPEHIAEYPNTVEGNIARAVHEAEDGALIILTGFDDRKLPDRERLLQLENDNASKKIEFLNLSGDENALHTAVQKAQQSERQLKIIGDRPTFIEDALLKTGLINENLSQLKDKNNPIGTLMKWLIDEEKVQNGQGKGESDAPSHLAIASVFTMLVEEASKSSRDFIVALPLDNALALYFFAFALKGRVTIGDIEETKERIGTAEDPIGVLNIKDGHFYVTLGGREAGVRPF